MNIDLLVIENFYDDPKAVRDYAMSLDYEDRGAFGYRSEQYFTGEAREKIEQIMSFSGSIIDWYLRDGYTASFQIVYENHPNWVHTDRFNQWAGVWYGHPDAPLTSGTSTYRHIETGQIYDDPALDCDNNDLNKWEKVHTIGNKFNRLVIYRSDLWHRADNYFGHDKQTGRMFQTFFFNTNRPLPGGRDWSKLL